MISLNPQRTFGQQCSFTLVSVQKCRAYLLVVGVVAAILDLCTTATSILKNNAGNGFLVVNLVRKVVLYIFIGQNVKKLYFHYGSWRPF